MKIMANIYSRYSTHSFLLILHSPLTYQFLTFGLIVLARTQRSENSRSRCLDILKPNCGKPVVEL